MTASGQLPLGDFAPPLRSRILVPLERDEMRALVSWLEFSRIDYCHVPNEQRHRRFGVKSGVPDILIFTPPPSVPSARGVAVELKRRDGGVVSEKQRAWIQRLEQHGWICTVAAGATEAIRWLQERGY